MYIFQEGIDGWALDDWMLLVPLKLPGPPLLVLGLMYANTCVSQGLMRMIVCAG